MVVPANPGPPKRWLMEWNGPLEAGVAAGGGRERRSRPGREGGGGSGLPRARAQQAGVQLGSGAAGQQGPNGKQWGPCIRGSTG